jgi:hypothetical protein
LFGPAAGAEMSCIRQRDSARFNQEVPEGKLSPATVPPASLSLPPTPTHPMVDIVLHCAN